MYAWGANTFGALGTGMSGGERLAPVAISSLSSVSELAVGTSHTCVKTASDVRCWGRNFDGELGDGSFTDRNAPVVVGW